MDLGQEERRSANQSRGSYYPKSQDKIDTSKLQQSLMYGPSLFTKTKKNFKKKSKKQLDSSVLVNNAETLKPNAGLGKLLLGLTTLLESQAEKDYFAPCQRERAKLKMNRAVENIVKSLSLTKKFGKKSSTKPLHEYAALNFAKVIQNDQ